MKLKLKQILTLNLSAFFNMKDKKRQIKRRSLTLTEKENSFSFYHKENLQNIIYFISFRVGFVGRAKGKTQIIFY